MSLHLINFAHRNLRGTNANQSLQFPSTVQICNLYNLILRAKADCCKYCRSSMLLSENDNSDFTSLRWAVWQTNRVGCLLCFSKYEDFYRKIQGFCAECEGFLKMQITGLQRKYNLNELFINNCQYAHIQNTLIPVCIHRPTASREKTSEYFLLFWQNEIRKYLHPTLFNEILSHRAVACRNSVWTCRYASLRAHLNYSI